VNSLAVVDFPIPIEPVSPSIRIVFVALKRISNSQQSLAAQECKQRQQRQAENREVIAFEAIE